ncbi:MAG: hypothetical protein OXC63_08300 [Aestuariivita sp.]|nr:hypothetical protein [Aestuariivita sp.]MCY4345392.1 hypothetical protein [Aestuariivita sp.]
MKSGCNLPRALRHAMAVVATLWLLAGCASVFTPNLIADGSPPRAIAVVAADVSEVQACAIGYDLARAIYENVSLRRTVIIAPKRATACEKHTLNYLRLAGFRIDDRGTASQAAMSILIERNGRDNSRRPTISAVVEIGEDLRITRPYQPIRSGVVPMGPIAVQYLNPDTYERRDT